jgi:hypothetical protein
MEETAWNIWRSADNILNNRSWQPTGNSPPDWGINTGLTTFFYKMSCVTKLLQRPVLYFLRMGDAMDCGLYPMANSGLNSVEHLGSTPKGLAVSCLADACYMHYPSPSSWLNCPRILCSELKLCISHTYCSLFTLSHMILTILCEWKIQQSIGWWDTAQIPNGQDFNLDSGYLKYSCLPFCNLTFSGFTALVTRLIKTRKGGSYVLKLSHLLLFTKVCQIVDWNTDAIPKNFISVYYYLTIMTDTVICLQTWWHACTYTCTQSAICDYIHSKNVYSFIIYCCVHSHILVFNKLHTKLDIMMDLKEILSEHVTSTETVQDKNQQGFSGVHFPNIVLYVSTQNTIGVLHVYWTFINHMLLILSHVSVY